MSDEDLGVMPAELEDPERVDDRVRFAVTESTPNGRRGRQVSLSADEARAWALKLLTAAGPNTDELVRSWVAGGVRVTVEAPAGCECVLDPILSVSPETEEEFERVLGVLGGLVAFDDFSAHATYAQLHMSAPPLGAEGPGLGVMLKPPPTIARTVPPVPPGLRKLQERQREEKAQVAEEQEAADAVARELGPGPGRDHMDD